LRPGRVCVLGAFADGAQDEAERARIQQIVNGFSGEQFDLTPVYQQVLEGKLTLADASNQLQSPAAAALAYEMAVCVCNADGVLSEPEKKFLSDLRHALHLDTASAEAHQQTAQAIAAQPLDEPLPPTIDPGREADLDKLILNTAILNGALEIMPHTLATMAIVPLQMRMVYRIGSRYGCELDRGHIRDFLATVGVGLTSQVFEGFARRLVGGFAGRLAGGLLGGLAGQATGSAFGFATTYALGQVAKRYYASGRNLSAAQLKEAFSSMLQDARSMQGRHTDDIMAKSRQVNVSELLPMIRQQ
jgi:uncharacterized protein (DUF697 family)/tellurite resistance protein